MDKKEVFDFINKNQVCFLATAEEKQPRVRGMMVVEANEDGILFSTGRPKVLFSQLKKNSLVELCFFDNSTNTQVRVSGLAEFTDSMDIKNRVLEKFPFLKPLVDQNGYEILTPFYIKKAKAVVWTMESNHEPKKYIDLYQ